MPIANGETTPNDDDDGLLRRLEEPVLVTGATGFVGLKVVERLLAQGFRNLRCFVRNPGDSRLRRIASNYSEDAIIEIFAGDLLSREDCSRAAKDIAVIYHLAVGPSGKSFP